MYSPTKAKTTVSNEAAGNRTETLNSSICNKSTEINFILLLVHLNWNNVRIHTNEDEYLMM